MRSSCSIRMESLSVLVLVLLVSTAGFSNAADLRDDQDGLAIFVIKPDGSDVQLVVETPVEKLNRCTCPEFSRDGSKLVFDMSPGKNWQGTNLGLLELTGNRAGEIRDLGIGSAATWSQDGQQLAMWFHNNAVVGVPSGLFLMTADGESHIRFGSGVLPRWSPNADLILTPQKMQGARIPTVIDVFTGEMRELKQKEVTFMSRPTWMPDGKSIVTVAFKDEVSSLMEYSLTEDSFEFKRTLWTNEDDPEEPMLSLPAISPDGKTIVGSVYLERDIAYLDRIDLTKNPPVRTRLEPQLDGVLNVHPRWSPDGKWIVFASNRATDGIPQFFKEDTEANE